MSVRYDRNHDVSIERVMPDYPSGTSFSNYLSMSDIRIPSENLNPFRMTTSNVFEYDFIFPVDLAKAVNESDNTIGFQVSIFNESPGPAFNFSAYFVEDILGNIDIGEEDRKTQLRRVLNERTVQVDPSELGAMRVDLSAGHSGAVSGDVEAALGQLAADGDGPGLAEVLDGDFERAEDNRGRLGFFFNDVLLREPRVLTDGRSLAGIVSIADIKASIRREGLDAGNAQNGTYRGALVSALEDTLSGEAQEALGFRRYRTTVLPVRRKLRISQSLVNPFRVINVRITPILALSVSRRRGANLRTVPMNRTYNMLNSINEILEPVGKPSVIINAQGPTYVVATIEKKDPTLVSGICQVRLSNTVDHESEPRVYEQEVEFGASNKASVRIAGFSNVYPHRAIFSFHGRHSRQENTFTSGRSVTLRKNNSAVNHFSDVSQSFHTAVDTVRLTAISTDAGVTIRSEGSIPGADNVVLMRENVSLSAGTRRPVQLGPHTPGSTSEDIFVARGSTYRYFLRFDRELPMVLHEDAPLETRRLRHGQTRRNSIYSRSLRSVEHTFMPPTRQIDIEVNEPFVGVDGVEHVGQRNQDRRSFVGMRIKIPDLVNLSIEHILATVDDFLRNIRAANAELNVGNSLLSREVPIILVSRQDRITGEEVSVATVIGDQSQVEDVDTVVKDYDIFSNFSGSGSRSQMGRYTYKFKVCTPTLGALANTTVDISGGPQERNISALKYLSNSFVSEGRIQSRATGVLDSSFVSVVEAFDSHQRVYVDYDPGEESDALIGEISLSCNPHHTGFEVKWELNRYLKANADYYMIFKTKRGQKRLKAVVAAISARAATYQAYYDYPRLVSNLLTSQCVYQVSAIDRRGRVIATSNSVSNIELREDSVSNELRSVQEVAQNIHRYATQQQIQDGLDQTYIPPELLQI